MALFLPAYLNIATYSAPSGGIITGVTTAGTTQSLLSLFSSNTNTKRIEIYRITATAAGGNAGSCNIRGTFITADGTGGSAITGQPIDKTDPASSLTSTTGLIRAGATGAPTRIAGDLFCYSMGGAIANQQYILFDYNRSGKPILLRPSVSEGFEVRVSGTTTISTALKFTVDFLWTEV